MNGAILNDKAYKAVESEAERLRQAYGVRVADAVDDCSKIRMNLGALRSASRRQSITLVRRMQDLDNALLSVKVAIRLLQKSIDIDQRRDGVMRQEEHSRKDRIRQERIDILRKEVKQRRERKRNVQNNG